MLPGWNPPCVPVLVLRAGLKCLPIALSFLSNGAYAAGSTPPSRGILAPTSCIAHRGGRRRPLLPGAPRAPETLQHLHCTSPMLCGGKLLSLPPCENAQAHPRRDRRGAAEPGTLRPAHVARALLSPLQAIPASPPLSPPHRMSHKFTFCSWIRIKYGHHQNDETTKSEIGRRECIIKPGEEERSLIIDL